MQRLQPYQPPFERFANHKKDFKAIISGNSRNTTVVYYQFSVLE